MSKETPKNLKNKNKRKLKKKKKIKTDKNFKRNTTNEENNPQQLKERLVDLVITLTTKIKKKKSCIEYFFKKKGKKGFLIKGKCVFLINLSVAKLLQKVSKASIL